MSEHDELWYCPNCEEKQVFVFGGTMTDGICMECEKTYLRIELIEIAREKGLFKNKIRLIERPA